MNRHWKLLMNKIFNTAFESHEMISYLALISYVACDRDNSKLCSCGGDRQVFYWDVSTGRVIRKFRGHDSEVCS